VLSVCSFYSSYRSITNVGVATKLEEASRGVNDRLRDLEYKVEQVKNYKKDQPFLSKSSRKKQKKSAAQRMMTKDSRNKKSEEQGVVAPQGLVNKLLPEVKSVAPPQSSAPEETKTSAVTETKVVVTCVFCKMDGHNVHECKKLMNAVCSSCKQKGHTKVKCPFMEQGKLQDPMKEVTTGVIGVPRKPPIKKRVQQGVGNSTPSITDKHIGAMSQVFDEGERAYGHAFRLETWWIVPRHVVMAASKASGSFRLKGNKGRLLQFKQSDFLLENASRDLLVFSDSPPSDLTAMTRCLRVYSDCEETYETGCLVGASGVAMVTKVHKSIGECGPDWKYSANTFEGDCGRLLFVMHKGVLSIIGIHRWGGNTPDASWALSLDAVLEAAATLRAPKN